MEEHGLTQADLKAELGSQSVASDVLNGKRQINARQAKALAARFKVSSAVFI
jgi:HTH-type transcriptional regulator/antitoxin HigA